MTTKWDEPACFPRWLSWVIVGVWGVVFLFGPLVGWLCGDAGYLYAYVCYGLIGLAVATLVAVQTLRRGEV